MEGSGKVNPTKPRGPAAGAPPLPFAQPSQPEASLPNVSTVPAQEFSSGATGVPNQGVDTAGGSAGDTKAPDSLNPGLMGIPGMPGFFPFPPAPVPGIPGTENKGEGEPDANSANMTAFGGWIMERMMSMGMMQSGGTSIDGSLMPAMPYAPGSSGLKSSEGSSMPMMFYPPMMMDGMPPEFPKDASGNMMPPPNLMMPMLPFMDEKTALQSLSQLMPQKTSLQKKASELDNMKSIPTSVQIRETCQLKAWRRKLQKGRAQLKMDAEAGMSPKHVAPEPEADGGPAEQEAPREAESLETAAKDVSSRQCGSMDVCWQQNRFRGAGTLSEADMRDMRLFDRNTDDSEMRLIRAALDRMKDVDIRCYPYMFMGDIKLPGNGRKGHMRVWDDTDGEQSTTEETPLASPLPERPVTPQSAGASAVAADASLDDEWEVELEAELPNPADADANADSAEGDWEAAADAKKDADETASHSASSAAGDMMDALEDELLEGISSGSNSSDAAPEDLDLDDEFDFDVADNDVAPPPAPPMYPLTPSGLPDTGMAGDVSLIDDPDLFGEVPGTLSHYRAKLCKLLNAGDVVHEWRGFRSRLTNPLSLTDLVEFEHLWKLFQDRRVEDLAEVLGRSTGFPAVDTTSEESGNLLYRVGQAHLKLLLDYSRPEIQQLVRSSIYNLNATNVIYTVMPSEDDINPNEDDLLQPEAAVEASPKEAAAEPVAALTPVNPDDDMLLVGKESEVRRNWRRRLQTLAKETRLALVNMGKSLRDIENVSSNVEQTRAYDSVVEFCEVAEQFRQHDYVTMLNQSFDEYYEKNPPHDSGQDGVGPNRRELLHTLVAKNLTGIMPLVGKAAKYHNVRFHKPDFRGGLFTEHMRVLRGNYSFEWSSWPARPLLSSSLVASFTDESNRADGMRSHPSNYFIQSSDLALNDDCKIALLEYIEQHPLLLPNCGMASRIDNYVNYNEEDDQKDVAFLGPLGTLCQASDGIDLFGIKHTVEPGDGQAILESTLYKAPIFVHPRPGSPHQGKLNISTTDFLLTRTRSNEEVVVRLRPLTWQSGVAVYTVGQCEPKVEVHPPSSKSYMEHTNDLLKAWVLKSLMVGSILDVKHMRKEARQKFCPLLSEKDISHMLKQIESTPIFSQRPPYLERMIHSTIKPELVCALESVRAGRARLSTMGVLHLKNPDNIGGVYAKMQDEERQYQQRLQQMDKRLRELKSSYAKRLEAHGLSGDKVERELEQFDFGLQVSIYGHLEEKTMAPRIRFIKELLDLTPWNISRDVKQVLNNKGTSQFSLYGAGDPSGGRGEGINLLKRQAHDVSVDQTLAGEDLRKLSMQELAKRLRCYGVSEAVIKTLPRWDQVALVRQYRDGFGGQGAAEGDHRWRIPPEEYQKKLNEILMRQRAALSSDDPAPSDGDGAREGDAQDAADGIADALMEAFDEVSDKDDDLERRELEILRQLREAQSAGPLSEEERMAEVNKLKAVPGVMWLRQSRRTSNEPFGNERAVFVYGEENLRKLLRWRMQRAAARKYNMHGDIGPGSRRICRACGQSGHIASNPKCPLYKGDKGRGGSTPAMSTRKQARYDDSSDGEITASTAALERDSAEWLRRSQDPRVKRRLTYQASMEESDDGLDPLDEGSLVATRRKQPRSAVDVGSVPVQNLSSQMEQVLKLVSKAVRMVEKEPRFRPFTSRVPESVAPNYYNIIKNPMWLSLLKSKCKTRCYNDLVQVLDDLGLIELNCKQFNSETSPNAWLRKLSETLVDELLMRIQQLTSHLVSASVIEDWANEHRANRVGAGPAPAGGASATAPQVEII
ncbi:histone acetyltransferase TAF1/250 [Babesia caballi]|uniref:Histone acetyltransferase TAF1/250 n=1 Tax=Babesia caballi TaxID=5871 RepID=A0AAV4M2I0_BABCB|nr:histone acetyltransferase TAF1/250 [Babesia caballi]